jgi:hypothetical protein
MIEKINLFYNDEKTLLNMEVTLSLIDNEKEHFTFKEAQEYLNSKNIKYIKMLSGTILSNSSDRRRKGNFLFLVESPLNKLKKKKKEE